MSTKGKSRISFSFQVVPWCGNIGKGLTEFLTQGTRRCIVLHMIQSAMSSTTISRKAPPVGRKRLAVVFKSLPSSVFYSYNAFFFVFFSKSLGNKRTKPRAHRRHLSSHLIKSTLNVIMMSTTLKPFYAHVNALELNRFYNSLKPFQNRFKVGHVKGGRVCCSFFLVDTTVVATIYQFVSM